MDGRARKATTLLTILILCVVVSGKTEYTATLITDEDVDSKHTTLAGGDVDARYQLYSKKGDVNVAFENVSWDDLPEGTLITTHTHSETVIEEVANADIADLGRSFDRMAEYLIGERSRLDKNEYILLQHFKRLTDAEIMAFYGDYLTPELNGLREAIKANQEGINDTNTRVTENRKLIKNNHDKINELINNYNNLAYKMEAVDLTLKKMDTDTYCESLRQVMTKYGMPKVECDINQKVCYNGNVFKFEDGRDWCVHLDEWRQPPNCYKKNECGSLVNVSAYPMEAGMPLYLQVTVVNPSYTDRVYFVEAGGGQTEFNAPAKTESVHQVKILSEDRVTTSLSELNVKVVLEGKEVYDTIPVTVYGRGYFLNTNTVDFTLHPDASWVEYDGRFDLNAVLVNTANNPVMYPIQVDCPNSHERFDLYLLPGETRETLLGCPGVVDGGESWKVKTPKSVYDGWIPVRNDSPEKVGWFEGVWRSVRGLII